MKILEFFKTMKFSREELLEFVKNKKVTKRDLLKFPGTKKVVRNEYLDSIDRIKQGDAIARKDFTDRHKGFILETISHSLGKSTVPKNSPEFDIGLDAFDHSIDLFNPDKDKDFLLFSEQIIKEWVLSYIREGNTNHTLDQIDEEKYYLYCNYESTKDISQFKMNLWEYGIKLGELPNLSPDEKQNIGICVRIARKLYNDNDLFQKVAKDKTLSLEDFTDSIKVDKRIFYKHKKYIIALTLILKNNLKLLCSYLKNVNLRNDYSENIGVILEVNNDQAILFTLQGEFLTIKLSKTSKVGEQIKFGSYRIQKKNANMKYIVAACAVTSIIIFYAIYQGCMLVINNDKPVAAYNTEVTPVPSYNKNATDTQKNTSDNLIAEAINTVEPEITSTPSVDSTPTKTSAILVLEPSDSIVPATRPINTNAVATPVKSTKVSPIPTTVTKKQAAFLAKSV